MMKKPACLLLISLLTTLSTGSIWAAATDENPCVLKVGWEEWYPFIYQQGQTFSGSEYTLLSRLAKKTGCQLKFVEVAWDKSLQQLAQGKLDMLFGASMTDERKTYAQFSQAYRFEQIVLVVADTSDSSIEPSTASISLKHWLEQKNASQQPRRLGLILGYYYGDHLEPILRAPTTKPQIIEMRWDQKLHQQLINQQIDGYLIEASVVQSQRASSPTWLNVQEFRMEPLHLMFSRQIPADIVERFDRAINDTSQTPN